MSSDKGDKTIEILYTISNFPTFWMDIKFLRKDFDIPIDGFENVGLAKTWILNNRELEFFLDSKIKENRDAIFKEKEYEKRLIELIKKYKIPPALLYIFEQYVLYNKPFEEKNHGHLFSCAIESPKWEGTPLSEEDRWKLIGKPYVRLLIHEQATLVDVKNYLDKNWKHIRNIFGKLNNNQKSNRLRTRTFKERDSFLFENKNKTAVMLRQELKSLEVENIKSEYKEYLLAKLVQHKFGGKIMTRDAVIKAIKREEKRRKMDI
jgi:hypothetical protein